jgi:hypothetical protein
MDVTLFFISLQPHHVTYVPGASLESLSLFLSFRRASVLWFAHLHDMSGSALKLL